MGALKAIAWPPGPWAIDTAPALVGGATAVFSEDRRYRYALTREWGPGEWACWLMLNPSTADAFDDDATIARCIKRTQAWGGYGGLVVVNLFAFRATDPAALVGHPDPVGTSNDVFIRAAVAAAGLVIVAWGGPGDLCGRDEQVRPLIEGARPACLGVTVNGQPRHPLYLRANAELRPYLGREAAA